MLDDAIRQHLDLKRRTGAAESEVERLESEAFGPVRREPAPAAPVDAPADVEPQELPPPPATPPEPVAEQPAPPPVAESWLDDEEEDLETPPELPPVAPDATTEFTAEDVHAARGSTASADYVAPDDEGEDLLEETPEFLQETPEHDRLWFEQKPPRDFDFDQ